MTSLTDEQALLFARFEAHDFETEDFQVRSGPDLRLGPTAGS